MAARRVGNRGEPKLRLVTLRPWRRSKTLKSALQAKEHPIPSGVRKAHLPQRHGRLPTPRCGLHPSRGRFANSLVGHWRVLVINATFCSAFIPYLISHDRVAFVYYSGVGPHDRVQCEGLRRKISRYRNPF
jgi:hypothetical protein